MIGTGYWACGITVTWTYSGMNLYGWSAIVDYLDDGFVSDIPGTDHISTEGRLRTRYAVRNTADGANSLGSVVDVIKADAERLGITWRDPAIWYRGDGEDEDYPPPEGWRDMLAREAERIGWRTYGAVALRNQEAS